MVSMISRRNEDDDEKDEKNEDDKEEDDKEEDNKEDWIIICLWGRMIVFYHISHNNFEPTIITICAMFETP